MEEILQLPSFGVADSGFGFVFVFFPTWKDLYNHTFENSHQFPLEFFYSYDVSDYYSLEDW